MTSLNGKTTAAHPAFPLLAQAHLLLVAAHGPSWQLNPAQRARMAGLMANALRWVQLHVDSGNLPDDEPLPPALPGRMDHAGARVRIARERLEDLAETGRPATEHQLVGSVEAAAHHLELAWLLTLDIGGYPHVQQVTEIVRHLSGVVRMLAEIAEATSAEAAGGGWSDANKLLNLALDAVRSIGQAG